MADAIDKGAQPLILGRPPLSREQRAMQGLEFREKLRPLHGIAHGTAQGGGRGIGGEEFLRARPHGRKSRARIARIGQRDQRDGVRRHGQRAQRAIMGGNRINQSGVKGFSHDQRAGVAHLRDGRHDKARREGGRDPGRVRPGRRQQQQPEREVRIIRLCSVGYGECGHWHPLVVTLRRVWSAGSAITS